MTTVRLLCTQGGSNKYWEIDFPSLQEYTNVTFTRFGRIGSAPQLQRKVHDGPDVARAYAQGKVREKLNKGYTYQRELPESAPARERPVRRRRRSSKSSNKSADTQTNSSAPAADTFVLPTARKILRPKGPED